MNKMFKAFSEMLRQKNFIVDQPKMSWSNHNEMFSFLVVLTGSIFPWEILPKKKKSLLWEY